MLCSVLQIISPLLLAGYSLEATPRDIAGLARCRAMIPDGTQIAVPYLPGQDLAVLVGTAAAVADLGLTPVPHIAARRLESRESLRVFLNDLAQRARIDRVFVVAGDLPEPAGPFKDALAVIESGLLPDFGIRRVGIAGYPEGNPVIGGNLLWQALLDKRAALASQHVAAEIVTQFGFDATSVLAWLASLRERGVSELVRVGLPGPASVKTLLAYAARCGVAASAKVLSQYGLSITKLLSAAGPDRLFDEIVLGLDPMRHGAVALHLFPFGGVEKSILWTQSRLAGAAL